MFCVFCQLLAALLLALLNFLYLPAKYIPRTGVEQYSVFYEVDILCRRSLVFRHSEWMYSAVPRVFRQQRWLIFRNASSALLRCTRTRRVHDLSIYYLLRNWNSGGASVWWISDLSPFYYEVPFTYFAVCTAAAGTSDNGARRHTIYHEYSYVYTCMYIANG